MHLLLLLSQAVGADHIAVQVLPAEVAVLQYHVAVAGALLGNGHRAGIHVGYAVYVHALGHVGVAVEQNVALTQGRQLVKIVVVTVSGEHGAVACLYQGIVG